MESGTSADMGDDGLFSTSYEDCCDRGCGIGGCRSDWGE